MWRPRLRRSDFLRATRDGRRVTATHFLVFVYDRRDGRTARLGITVTRKVGNAVFRNRIKRLVREWFRPRRTQLGSRDLVVIANRGIPSNLVLSQVESDLERSFEIASAEPRGRPESPST